MIITHHGKQFFKIQLGDTTLAFNPISKESKAVEKPAKFGANVMLSSVRHPDYYCIETVTYNDKAPFIVDGPGDYEVLGNFVKGLESKTQIDGEEHINTVYTMQFDGINMLFLGHLISRELAPAVREAIDAVDIVFVPLGEKSLAPMDAYKLAISFEPKIIIPMEYDSKTDAKLLQQFLKESGDDSKKPEDKLTIKPKDLAGKEAEVVVLSS